MFSRLFLFLILVSISSGLFAQEIAIVDVNLILKSASAVQTLEKQLNDKKISFEKDVKNISEKIKNMEKDLSSKKEILSAEAFNQQIEDFRKKIADEEEQMQKKKISLESSYMQAYEKINDQSKKIIDHIANSSKVDVVLPKSQTLFISSNVKDISNQVLESLNRQLPTVNIEESK